MKKMDFNNFNHRLIVAALTNMIDDEGLTIHEVAEVYEDIKRQIFPTLLEMRYEKVKRNV